MRAVIVGGGIGGLSAAIALALRGHEVSVLEQAPELLEVGAGLQISPNGTKALAALGVLEALKPQLFEPKTVEMRLGVSGRRIFSIPMQRIARERWGAAYYQVHRADLVEALRNRLETLQPGAIRLGVRVTGYRQDADQALVLSGENVIEKAELLIGADGIRSTLRTQMLGAQDPRFTGHVAWRAVVPVERLAGAEPAKAGCVWVGSQRHAVTTYLRAGRLVNFVGVVQQPGWHKEGWNHPGDPAQARADFEGWHPTIQRILGEVDIIHRWALFDRPPLERWSDGRVVLMGDACHPMLPSMAQGAVQALEDAWTLAECVGDGGALERALQSYFQRRIARVSAIQRRSATNARLFHLQNAALRTVAYAPLAIADRVMPSVLYGLQDTIYGHDIC